MHTFLVCMFNLFFIFKVESWSWSCPGLSCCLDAYNTTRDQYERNNNNNNNIENRIKNYSIRVDMLQIFIQMDRTYIYSVSFLRSFICYMFISRVYPVQFE